MPIDTTEDSFAFCVDATQWWAHCLGMTNEAKTIKAGTTLKARSVCDHDCIFEVEVMERKGQFATVKAEGVTRRVKIYNIGDGEFVYALGKFSMAPIFRA